MSFLYPSILFGLLALAIPIIIHLFNFRKTKKILFSNNQFLFNIKKSTSSKLKLRHLLIMTSRLLFLLFLVLTFAQPFIPGEEKGMEKGEVFIYFDNSHSMSNEVEANLRALDIGLSYISDIIDLYPAGVQFTFLTNDFASFSNTPKSQEEIRDLMTEVNFSNVSRSLEEVGNRFAFKQPKAQNLEKYYYFISDFQKSTTGALNSLTFDSLGKISIVPIEYRNEANIFIDSVYLSNPFLTRNVENELNVRIVNTGHADLEDLILKFFINEKQVSSASLNIPSLSRGLAKFNLNFQLERLNRCRLNFEEFPVAFDNDFYFNLNIADPVTILEIKNTESATPVGKVYGNGSLFNFSSHNVQNVDYNLIGRSDLVIINGLDRIEPSFGFTLLSYLGNGGSIFLIPSGQPDINSYQQLVPGMQAVQDKLSDLATLNLDDPFYQNIFENREERFEMPECRNVISWPKAGRDLLLYPNKKPFLSRFRGQGIINILGSPIEDEFTNFHRHAIFVPVLYRMAFQSKSVNDRLSYTLNETVIALVLDSITNRDILKLSNPEGEVIPNQRVVDNLIYLELPRYTLDPGFYNLMKDQVPQKVLSFNYDKNESILEQYDREEIQLAYAGLPNVTIFNLAESNDFSQIIKEKHLGVPLWKYSLILALIFLLTEVLLIRFL